MYNFFKCKFADLLCNYIAGLSTTLPDQVHNLLDVVHTGLRAAGANRRKEAQKRRSSIARDGEREVERAEMKEKIERGVWRDGRVDCVAGNGIMSELGVGIER